MVNRRIVNVLFDNKDYGGKTVEIDDDPIDSVEKVTELTFSTPFCPIR